MNFSGYQVLARSLFWIDFILHDFLTYLIRIFFIDKTIWCGLFKSSLMVSSSITCSCDGKGWKTDARRSAKAVVSFCTFWPRCADLFILVVCGVEEVSCNEWPSIMRNP